jgi:hypothetical protein
MQLYFEDIRERYNFDIKRNKSINWKQRFSCWEILA